MSEQTQPITDTNEQGNHSETFNIDKTIADFQYEIKMKYSIPKLINKAFQNRHRQQKRNQQHRVPAFKIISLNLRGKGGDMTLMRLRMKEWRSKIMKQSIDIILVQDTHIASIAQSVALQQLWLNGWGLTSREASKPWSWWSVGSGSIAGVGILVNPNTTFKEIKRMDGFNITTRKISIKTDHFMIVNIYAHPHQKSERETFFEQLTNQLIPFHLTENIVLAGDFNCCLRPVLDRQFLPNRNFKSESNALSNLILQLDLIDTIDLLSTDNGRYQHDTIDYSEYFTYQRANAASRIDRFYISSKITAMFGDHKIWTSAIRTDHQCVDISFRDPKQIPQGRKESKLFPTTIRNKMLQHKCIERALQYINDAFNRWKNATKIWELGKLLLLYVLAQLKKHDSKQQRWLLHLRKQRLKQKCQLEIYTPELARLVLTKEQSIQKAAILMKKMHQSKYQAMTNQHTTATFYNRYKQGKDYKLITHIDGASKGQIDSVATNMAAAWKVIFKSTHVSNRKAIKKITSMFSEFKEHLQPKVTEQMNDQLIAAIEIEDVIKAIKKMENKKTPGPDLIGNEFYKLFRDLLAPILCKVFNYSLNTAEMPVSFQNARIYPQEKRGDSPEGLNYRPIACLNGDYKLLTRILAEKLKYVMNEIVSDSQHGGLPGRHLNGAIYKAQAAMATVINQQETIIEDSSAMMLLDIQKAYDSLERQFVYKVLQHLHFSDRFIQIIKAIHTSTTAYFVVNGLSSNIVTITRGIRQGCPIAPLIFILAVEVLLTYVNETSLVQGIKFNTRLNTATITSVAFIDDTTIFINKLRQLPQLLSILDKFADLSGLQLNKDKTKLLLLNTAHCVQTYCKIKVVQSTEYATLLGLQLGYINVDVYNWELIKKKVLKRMQFFASKTSNLVSRRKLLTMIIGAQIAFVAQYFLPTKTYMDQLQRDILKMFWKGYLQDDVQQQTDQSNKQQETRKYRNPLAIEMTLLPKKDGGLGVLDVTFLIMTTTLRMANRWATMAPSAEKSAINYLVVQQTTLTSPVIPIQKYGKKGLKRAKTDRNFWSYAIKIYSQVIFSNKKVSEYNKLLAEEREWLWNLPWIQQQDASTMKWQLSYFDRQKWHKFCKKRDKIITSALQQQILHSSITINWFLTDRDGNNFKSATLKNKTFYDVFEVTRWTTYSGTITPLHKSRQTADILIAYIILGINQEMIVHNNWPSMYGMTEAESVKTEYGQIQDCLILTSKQPDLTAVYKSFDLPIEFYNDKKQKASAYAPFSLPYISALLWREEYYQNDELKENFRLSRIKKKITKKATTMYYQKFNEFKVKRHQQWQSKQSEFKDIWQNPKINATAWRSLHAMGVENFWLRFIYNIHNLWWSDQEQHTECPIEYCNETNYNTKTHIFFSCVRARFVYKRLLKWWLGSDNFIIEEWFNAFFTNIPAQLPVNLILTNVSKTVWVKKFQIIWETTKTIWKLATQIIPMYLWMHRNELFFQQKERNHTQAWNEIWMIIRNNLTSFLDYNKRKKKKEITKIIEIFLDNEINPNDKIVDNKQNNPHLGWFDGGYRTKTDKGAAGAILVKTNFANISIVDVSSEYLGQEQTNNTSEYKALYNLTILAKEQQFGNICIRGDSEMIIKQINNQHKCRKENLRKTLAKTLLNLRNINYYSNTRAAKMESDSRYVSKSGQ